MYSGNEPPWTIRGMFVFGIALLLVLLAVLYPQKRVGRSACARRASAEAWSADGRTARTAVNQSTAAVPATAPTRDRPGPQ